MDTNPNFTSILNALDMQNRGQNQPQNDISMQQRVDNYNACTQLTNKGVYIPDLIKKIDALEEKLKAIEANPKSSRIDQELFEVMESSVRGDAQVVQSKKKVDDTKHKILNELCMKDSRYKEAYDDYKRTVNAVYIRKKEQTTHGEEAYGVCNDSEGSIPFEESIQDYEETM